MANDEYQTDDIFFAVALMFVYGEECLLKISTDPTVNRERKRSSVYTLNLPSCDAAILFDDFKSGNLAISDLLSYIRTYSFITRLLRNMRYRNEEEWCSPSWIAGRGR
jgi:hypothetical protein